jgi:hypothetical protein
VTAFCFCGYVLPSTTPLASCTSVIFGDVDDPAGNHHAIQDALCNFDAPCSNIAGRTRFSGAVVASPLAGLHLGDATGTGKSRIQLVDRKGPEGDDHHGDHGVLKSNGTLPGLVAIFDRDHFPSRHRAAGAPPDDRHYDATLLRSLALLRSVLTAATLFFTLRAVVWLSSAKELGRRKAGHCTVGIKLNWTGKVLRLLCFVCLLGLHAAMMTDEVVGGERSGGTDTVASVQTVNDGMVGDEMGIGVSRTRPPLSLRPSTSTPTRGLDLPSELEFLLENYADFSVDERALVRELVANHRPDRALVASPLQGKDSANGYGSLDTFTYKSTTEMQPGNFDDPETTAERGGTVGSRGGGKIQSTNSKRSSSSWKTESPDLGDTVSAVSASHFESSMTPDYREGVDGLGPGPKRLPEDDGMRRNSPVGLELAQHEETIKGGNRTRIVHDDDGETSEHSNIGVLSAMPSADPTDEASSRLLATVTVLTQDLLAAYNSAAVGDTINLTPSSTAFTGAACNGGDTSLCMTKAVSILCAVGTASGSCTFDGLNTGTNGRRVVSVQTGTSATTVFQQITFTRGYTVR